MCSTCGVGCGPSSVDPGTLDPALLKTDRDLSGGDLRLWTGEFGLSVLGQRESTLSSELREVVGNTSGSFV